MGCVADGRHGVGGDRRCCELALRGSKRSAPWASSERSAPPGLRWPVLVRGQTYVSKRLKAERWVAEAVRPSCFAGDDGG